MLLMMVGGLMPYGIIEFRGYGEGMVNSSIRTFNFLAGVTPTELLCDTVFLEFSDNSNFLSDTAQNRFAHFDFDSLGQRLLKTDKPAVFLFVMEIESIV
ncbi:hypothetical protein Tco_0889008 [Tanacetum coccineum]